MGKFCMRDFVYPGAKVRPTEDLEVCFNFLIDMFCFTIRLRVVCSREGEVIVEEFSKFLGEGRGELWTTIRDDLL